MSYHIILCYILLSKNYAACMLDDVDYQVGSFGANANDEKGMELYQH